MSFLSRIMVVKSKAHFNAGGNNNRSAGAGGQSFEGTRKRSGSQARSRVAVMICCFGVAYAVIGGRLLQYGMGSPESVSSISPAVRSSASRGASPISPGAAT